MKYFVLIVCAFAFSGPTQAEKYHRVHHNRVDAGSILPHPQGCPRTAFCGCGVAVRVFGAPIRRLWLVANWLHFPRTAAQPGMVAVWPHHVAYIQQIIGDGLAMMFDPNSGHHETKEHVRSLRGAKIVDPHHSNIAWLTESDDSKPTRHHAARHHAKHRRLVLR
jgi:hypothetical protein